VTEGKQTKTQEPMWPSVIALAAAAALYIIMPDQLAIGPPWLLLAIVFGFMLPGEISHALGKHLICKLTGYAVLSIITLSMIVSVVLHVAAISQHSLPPARLLLSAIVLWITNILVFACWYWRLDAGGPHKRSSRAGKHQGAFLFPQMTLASSRHQQHDEYENWAPQFIDYLFLSFNTSTALSPTDVPTLSRWAKLLMMVQASISLTVIVLLAARAVNIL
jgi:hypothetical protein